MHQIPAKNKTIKNNIFYVLPKNLTVVAGNGYTNLQAPQKEYLRTHMGTDDHSLFAEFKDSSNHEKPPINHDESSYL